MRARFRIVCSNCFSDKGYGPMLRTIVWNAIEPSISTMYVDDDQNIRWGKFLCEDCVDKLLGGTRWYHLRDCPGNHDHPAYQPHGLED